MIKTILLSLSFIFSANCQHNGANGKDGKDCVGSHCRGSLDGTDGKDGGR